MSARPRTGALGVFVVALGVVGTSWLALRTMRRSQESARDAMDAATPMDTDGPVSSAIPSNVSADAATSDVARIDVVQP